jgi:transcriptional regulator with XRE-family HTH domain
MAATKSGYTITPEEYRRPAVGVFVKDVREARHITQAELARRCNLSRAYINALEGGNVKEPSAKTLGLLAGALGIDILEMLEATGTVVIDKATGISDESQMASYLRRNRKLSEDSIRSVMHLVHLFELGDAEKRAAKK